MLTVTTTAKDKLKETLQKQTMDPEVAIRVTSLHSRANRLELVLDKEKKGDLVVASEEGFKVLLICAKLAQGLAGLCLTTRKRFTAQILSYQSIPMPEKVYLLVIDVLIDLI